MAENPLWGDDWTDLRDQWLLDPTVTFLNHGSFGACPRPVLDRQLTLRNEMERHPVEFLWRRLKQLGSETRRGVGAFLGANPDDLVFVPNATAGAATVLASLSLGPGDQILMTDHAYPAIRNATRRTCDRTGADLLVLHIPLPLPPADEIAAAAARELTDRTRLLIIDHVTSPTAAVFPVTEIVAHSRARGVSVMVDAAHAPGMLPIDLTALSPDFWTGNFHKWVCAPKGAAALWVRSDHQAAVKPLITSHGYGGSFHDEFDWTGTHDPTPYLSVPAALEFFDDLGWDRVRTHNHELAAYGQRVVSEALGTDPPVPDDSFGSMAAVELPNGVAATDEDAAALQARLYDEHRIEVPIYVVNAKGLLRLSAQVYNCPQDYDRLAEALPRVL